MSDTTFSTQHPSATSRAARAYDPVPAPRPNVLSVGNVISLIVLGGLIVIPFFAKAYYLYPFTMIVVYSIAVLGLNLLTGINGQFSLGHSAFLAIGAFACAILIRDVGIHYMLTLPIVAIIAFIAGFLFGLPALRLEGLYLALATFALAVATPQILKIGLLEGWTGGVQGRFLFPDTLDPVVPFGLNIDPAIFRYFFTLAVFVVIYILSMLLIRSRTGRAFMAIRDNPIAARAMGINLPRYKATAFGISAMVTGVAGALYAILVTSVHPDSFIFTIAILILVGMVIGGVGWLPGCLIGGISMVYLPSMAEYVDDLVLAIAEPLGIADLFPSGSEMQSEFNRLSYFIYGVILILIIYLAPSGAGGLLRAVVTRAKRLFS